jgi:phenylalanyl-tRNA synthetase beta chain
VPPLKRRPAQSRSRYPAIIRDVSIVIDEALPAASVHGTIRRPSSLVSIAVRHYQGKGVPEGRVSLSLRLTFQDRIGR